jgi:N-acetylglutamate synthase-like GNAT family acetyltransferase
MGAGKTAYENLLLVADIAGEVVGVAAAAPALAQELGVALPWRVVDVMAVDGRYRGGGLGGTLLLRVYETAYLAGVSSLYRLCPPQLRSWYEKQGFSTTEEGAALDSHVYINGNLLMVGAEAGKVFFLTDAADGPRLYLPAGTV